MSDQDGTTGRLVESRRRRGDSAACDHAPTFPQQGQSKDQAVDHRGKPIAGRRLVGTVLGGLAFMAIVSIMILAIPKVSKPTAPLAFGGAAAVTQLQAPTSQQAAYNPPATGAVIAGTVVYTGKPVAPRAFVTVGDPMCTVPVFSEDVVVNANGTLSNVLIYVKQGLGIRTFAAPAGPLLVDARGYRIVPHVLAVQTGQPVEFRNSDPSAVTWNIATKRNRALHYGQPKTGMIFTGIFTASEVAIHISDDVHPWKKGYICVIAHPFFNVTNAAGVFRLEGLPPGTYVIESWHEKLGTTRQSVTVEDGDVAKITIKY